MPMQKEDFKRIFKLMHGKPVTIRTLDPPLHEFLPNRDAVIDKLAELRARGGPDKEIEKLEGLLQRIEERREANPMMGHRGCRVGITFPEITEMQVRAMFEAACEVASEGSKVELEVMIPLVGFATELVNQRQVAEKTAREVLKKHDMQIKYHVGTMIEVPRSALTADEIARHADFFSFGTNDLTQMTLGFSRDDTQKFMPEYIERAIIKDDPFRTLDQTGVGQLIEMAIKKGRAANPRLKIGICGEHGGDPESIEFCHRMGMDYVSCSPLRIPIAKLAAAQAALAEKLSS
jgi:pyruvate,orthophosphate dikinase